MQKKPSIASTAKKPAKRPQSGAFSLLKPGKLFLEDGTSFSGLIPSWQTKTQIGEVVFNTGMTGYVESLTDPSYAGEILTFTYPLIGNYGVNKKTGESNKIQAAGVIVSEASIHWDHTGATESFLEWLRAQNIPILMDADTRALTKYLRTKGTMAGAISPAAAKPGPLTLTPKIISIDTPATYNEQFDKTVILVDCGAKENILRSLLELPVRVKRVPYSYDYSGEDYAGVLLSNGPGDPTDYQPTIAIAQKALKIGKPVFGICLGNQILGLAAGAKTYKLKFGHRGHNQPCMQSSDERCYITSQNHGYALDAKTLPTGWEVSFTNLNDGSVEGIRHKTKPFFSVQFHPEACPGPTDTNWLFERFYKSL